MPRILLVDDDIAEISAVKRVLTRAGHQPVLATNASDATAAMGQRRPDLLVISSLCDNGEALALARRLSDDPDTAGIPLLVLGDAEDLPEDARRLARPVDPDLLTAEVQIVLASAGTAPPRESPAPAAPAPRPAVAKAPASAAASRPAPGARPGSAVAIGRVQPSRSAAPTAQASDPGPATPPVAAESPVSAAAARKGSPTRARPPAPGAPSPAKLADAAASRRAAADALRARAEELRRTTLQTSPAPASGDAPIPTPPPSRAQSGAILIGPESSRPARPSLAQSLDLEEGELEATLRKGAASARAVIDAARSAAADARHQAAEEALRALEEEAGTHTAEVARTRRGAARKAGGEEPAGAAEERALQEAIETARREAFEAAKRELQEQARNEAAEAARLIQAEARGRQEAVAAAQKESKELARREAEARERAQTAEREVQDLRSQLEDERRKAEERVASVIQRAAEEEEASDQMRRLAEDEIRRRDEQAARQRVQAARRDPAAADGPTFTPPPFFAPFDGAEGADPVLPATAEEAARRRVAALRSSQTDGDDLTPAPSPDFLWSEPARAELPRAAEPARNVEPPRTLEPPAPAPEEAARSIPQPAPQLRGGDLQELPAPRLLALASRSRLEGRIDFRGEVSRSLWFEDGRVVGASSADPSERVEEVALRLGLITRDQHRQIAQAASALPSRRAAMLLLERGFLKATELTGLVRRRTEEVVFGVFADAEARFRWIGVAVPPEERAALERGTLALAVEGVRRRWLAPRVDALLGGPASLLAPLPGAPATAELGLSADERRVVALADGLRALEEIVQASPMDALSTRQVLAALVLTGALSVRALQAGRPTGQASAAIDMGRVKEKLEQVRRADYFTVLGVGRLCTPHEVREAADRLQAEFEPGRFAGQPDEGLPTRLAEILQVIQDAREVLADDRLRDEYLRGLGDGG